MGRKVKVEASLTGMDPRWDAPRVPIPDPLRSRRAESILAFAASLLFAFLGLAACGKSGDGGSFAGADGASRDLAVPAECREGSGTSPPTPRHAELFALDEVEGARILRVWPSGRDGEAVEYVLVRRGCPAPATPGADGTILRTPVRRLATTSTTEIPFLDVLGGLGKLVAHAGVRYVTHPEVHRRLEAGDLVELGPSGAVDLERLVAARAEVVLASPGGDPWLETLEDLDRVETELVDFPSFREPTALGRAEWILAVGALLEKEEAAASWFEEVEDRYSDLEETARRLGPGPTVITGAPSGGIWFAPARESFLADLLRDGRGRSVWEALDGAVSEPLDLEAAFELGSDAEVWLQPGSFDSIREIRRAFPRFASLPAVRSGRIWNNDARTSGEWANDYWETGAARPDLVLADLLAIFHPGRIDHEPVFHRRLPEE